MHHSNWIRRDDMHLKYKELYFKNAKGIINEIYYDYSGFTDKLLFGSCIKNSGIRIFKNDLWFTTRPLNAKNLITLEEFLKWISRK